VTEAQSLARCLLDDESPRDFLRRLEVARPRPVPKEVEYRLDMEPENYPPEDDFDPEDVKWVYKELEAGNRWAWCRVRVQAAWEDVDGTRYEGNDYLTCCSYRNEQDFKAPGGYYDDMKQIAYNNLVKNVEADKAVEED
jgi:hypothetical protein